MAKAGQNDFEQVILHQLPREPQGKRNVPSSSPACYKLETYFRLTKIPYKNVFGTKMSSKGKCPWIEYRGEQVADSNFCILYLNEKFNVDLDKDLTPSEQAMARAFRTMLEENTVWTNAYYRFNDDYDDVYNSISSALPWYTRFWLPYAIKERIKDNMHGHGIGRHSREEVYKIAERDLRAVSDFLGDKDYLMGDKPTLVDCTAFALLAIFLWQWRKSPQCTFIQKELTNLEPYCQRMRALCYPDWEKIMNE